MSTHYERDLLARLLETPLEDHLVSVESLGYDMTRDTGDFTYTVISGPLRGTGYEVTIRQIKEFVPSDHTVQGSELPPLENISLYDHAPKRNEIAQSK